ncbi:hypothetical protein [Pseudonocardia sp.]|uniref:hypothetical protein n=1 Tax=Pseudonocardia sp. TaxID=60912 RepID=UPI002DB0AB57|nr:hypothetical protein [Pseudonocardia sp.]
MNTSDGPQRVRDRHHTGRGDHDERTAGDGVVLDLGSGGWSFVISSQARVTAVTSEVVLRLNGSHWCSP